MKILFIYKSLQVVALVTLFLDKEIELPTHLQSYPFLLLTIVSGWRKSPLVLILWLLPTGQIWHVINKDFLTLVSKKKKK